MRIHKFSAVTLASFLALAGCAQLPTGPTVAVTPAPYEPFPIFQQDQVACEQNAQAQVTNGLSSWGQGAVVPPNAQLPLQQQYDIAYTQCMSAKGNQAPGEPALAVPPPPPLGSPPPPQ